MKLASWRPKHCSCHVLLIKYTLYNKIVLYYKLIYFINYWKHNGDASPDNYTFLPNNGTNLPHCSPHDLRSLQCNVVMLFMSAHKQTIHTTKPTNALMLKLHFLHAICHNCDMFRSLLIIHRQLMRINKAYMYKHRRITEHINILCTKVYRYYTIRV
jgi:hypothetical protein